MPKLRDPVAAKLRDPRYRKQVVPDKKKEASRKAGRERVTKKEQANEEET